VTSALETDAAGLPMAATSVAAVDAWDGLLDAYGSFSPAVPDRLRLLLEIDPRMPLAQVARAALLMLSGKGALVAAARAAAASARALAETASPRERLHADAVAAWTHGRDDEALRRWEAILAETPCDFLALKLAQFGHFYAGGGPPMRASVDRVAGAWSPSVPRYSRYLGMRAFALEENGALGEAEALGREACALAADDPWAIHAVAHCLETRGAAAEGQAWIDAQAPHWAGAGTMDGHLRWHRALFALETEGPTAVAADFPERYHVDGSEEYLDLCNDVALLERLALRGTVLDDARGAVADALAPRAREHLLAFCDVHWVLGYAAAERFTDARAVLDGMRARATEDGPEAERYRTAAVPLAEGLLQHYEGAHEQAAATLLACRDRVHLIGGSHAQRDLFELLLIDATRAAGMEDRHRALLAERGRRPGRTPAH
jgi:hypothetical protein